jgi:hypothetical protein
MRRRNNNNNDNPNTDGTPILDECWKIVSNPQEEEEGYKIAALHIALDGNARIAEMLKSVKEQYYPAATDSDDYGT